MKQYDIGLDLGTTSIIIATQEQGVVFHQPSIGAVDTRSSTILAVGDKALRMVGRVPSYIDIIRPLRDGIIQDHRMTNELISTAGVSILDIGKALLLVQRFLR